MKFIIEVQDFYLDGEDLQHALTEKIKNDVAFEIQKSIASKVEEHITRKVKAEVEERMYRFMNVAIEDIIQKEKLKYDNKEMTLVEYIRNVFSNRNHWQNADESIKKSADKFGKEMKDRYDLLFASQLVAKLNNEGMLKEDVAKLLLDKPIGYFTTQ